MVQDLSLSTLSSTRSIGIYESTSSIRRQFKLVQKTHMLSGIGRQRLWHHCARRSLYTCDPHKLRQRNLKVEAGWLFGGSDDELDASSERSESANEDILIFFYQLDLATRVQVCLVSTFLLQFVYTERS